MKRIGIYHFNRATIAVLEIFGAIVLLLAIAWLLLIVRLSQGPMTVNYLTDKIESDINSSQTEFVVDVGSTVLIWGREANTLELKVKDMNVSRTDKTPVLFIDKVGIQVSKRHLIFGRIIPRTIKVYGPALRVIRNEDKSFSLNIDNNNNYRQHEETDSEEGNDFIKSILLSMSEVDAINILSNLTQIEIKDADVLYEDKILDVSWKSKGSTVVISRKSGGLSVKSVTNIEIDKGNYAFIRGDIFYSWQTHKPNGIFYFTGFNPSVFAQQSNRLQSLSNIDLSLDGSAAFEMNENFQLIQGNFILGGKKGKLNPAGIYEEPMDIKKIYIKGGVDYSINEISISEFNMDFVDAQVNLKAKLNKTGNDTLLRVILDISNMGIDSLDRYWPKEVAVDAREWVVGNLSKGIANRATLNADVLAVNGNLKNSKINKLDGEIHFSGVEVDYFSPLETAKNVSGIAKYDDKSFSLDIKQGNLKDIELKQAIINITDLDLIGENEHSKIDINLDLKGSVTAALRILNSKPLEYPKRLGIKSSKFKGEADINLKLKFPLSHDLKLKDVDIKAISKLENVSAKNIVSKYDLSDGEMNLVIDKDLMKIEGRGVFSNAPISFELVNKFSSKKIRSRLSADLLIGPSIIKELNAPDNLRLRGKIPAKVVYTVFKDLTSRLDLVGDITDFEFFIPTIEYKKEDKEPGFLKAKMYFCPSKTLYKVEGGELRSNDLFIKGSSEIIYSGTLIESVDLDVLRFGNTDVSLKFLNKQKDGYEFDISGSKFDISEIISKHKKTTNKEAAEEVKPSIVKMNVDKLIIEKDKYIEKIRMFMRSNKWNRIEHMEVNGVSGNAPIHLRYLPAKTGGYNLSFEAENAGAALSALGITNTVKGGKISVKGVPNLKSGRRDLDGYFTLSDFTLVKAPAMANLLNAISLIGIVELLNDEGISFKKMGSKFKWIDRGQPDAFENKRIFRLEEGKTSGASLGLTFEGDVDKWNNKFNLSGTIIPASGVSKILGAIPIVGDILTGGDGGGVFAATYKIEDDISDPKVTVNPLSVLAPGVLRKIFFE